ncbi:MAG: hypothetical protein HFJ67_08960 [Adlercreutzia mucosicola]|nr:hypothetical protein [Adlercreutzia mucosicola]
MLPGRCVRCSVPSRRPRWPWRTPSRFCRRVTCCSWPSSGSPRARARCSRCLPRAARWGVIRERLVISLNTAWFHTKNIYAKLGVHSRQGLIDLVEDFEPSA